MSQVDSLPLSWDAGLIVLSYIQAVQASYTAVHILQLRVSRWLYVVGALCLAVSGIWSMHFVGMAALRLPVNISFDLGWTIGSAFFAFVPCALGMLLVGEKVAYAPADDISVAAHLRVLKETAHHWMLAAGSLIALGVCAMHYTGMHAMRTEATHHHEWGTIIGSCFIALFAATAALYFAFVLPLTRSFTVPTSLVAGVAVCGMHYTGMYGISYRADRSQVLPGIGTNQLEAYVPYIVVGSWSMSFASLALATYLYRTSLKEEEERAKNGVAFATEMSRMIGRYQMARAMAYANSYEGKMDESLRNQFSAMLENLEPYKAYLPQSLFATDDGSEEEAEMGVDHEDEGSIVRSDTKTASSTVSKPSRYSSSCSTHSGVTDKEASHPSPLRRLSDLPVNKPVTILVINLRGFDQLLQRLGIRAAVSTVELLVEGVKKSTMNHRGVMDSLSGDRMTVTWNAASAVANQHRAAASSALEIRKQLQGSISLAPSMGLATGQAFVGNMGSSSFRRFCMIGKVVNDAYALESIAKDYDEVTILTTQRIAESLGSDFFYQHVGEARLPSSLDRKTILTNLEQYVFADSGEWMYQLQSCDNENKFAMFNELFVKAAENGAASLGNLPERLTALQVSRLQALTSPVPQAQ